MSDFMAVKHSEKIPNICQIPKKKEEKELKNEIRCNLMFKQIKTSKDRS